MSPSLSVPQALPCSIISQYRCLNIFFPSFRIIFHTVKKQTFRRKANSLQHDQGERSARSANRHKLDQTNSVNIERNKVKTLNQDR